MTLILVNGVTIKDVEGVIFGFGEIKYQKMNGEYGTVDTDKMDRIEN